MFFKYGGALCSSSPGYSSGFFLMFTARIAASRMMVDTKSLDDIKIEAAAVPKTNVPEILAANSGEEACTQDRYSLLTDSHHLVPPERSR